MDDYTFIKERVAQQYLNQYNATYGHSNYGYKKANHTSY